MYQYQWAVDRMIGALRKRRHDLTLRLVGGGQGPSQRLLTDAIAVADPVRVFVEQLAFLPQQELLNHLAQGDLFLSALGCENMPNTLLEAMAVEMTIACSNSGPMPEVLADGGSTFTRKMLTASLRPLKRLFNYPQCVWPSPSPSRLFHSKLA